MLANHRRHALAPIAALALVAGAAPVWAQPVMRIYDARDLAAALPAPSGAPDTGEGVYRLVLQRDPRGADGTEAPTNPPSRGASSATDLVVSRLCQQLKLEEEQIMDGVFLVTGESAQHEMLIKLLDDVRSLSQGAYEFEVFAYPAPAAQAPGVGTPADPQGAQFRVRQVVARRVESRIAVTEEVSYIRDWVPVVGNDSVGYDPEPGTVTKGLRLRVTAGGPEVGTPKGKDDSVPLRVRGDLIDATIDHVVSALAPVSGGNLELGLPTTSTRTIESDLRVKLGQSVVLCVVPGNKPGEVFVIAGTLRDLK